MSKRHQAKRQESAKRYIIKIKFIVLKHKIIPEQSMQNNIFKRCDDMIIFHSINTNPTY